MKYQMDKEMAGQINWTGLLAFQLLLLINHACLPACTISSLESIISNKKLSTEGPSTVSFSIKAFSGLLFFLCN